MENVGNFKYTGDLFTISGDGGNVVVGSSVPSTTKAIDNNVANITFSASRKRYLIVLIVTILCAVIIVGVTIGSVTYFTLKANNDKKSSTKGT